MEDTKMRIKSNHPNFPGTTNAESIDELVEAFRATLVEIPVDAEVRLADLCEGIAVSDARRATLARAIELGADDATLVELRDAERVKKDSTTILLPAQRLEGLSRGKGWCRSGRGSSAVWGERERGSQGGTYYRVGPGRWLVHGSDGYSRSTETEWVVRHVTVGGETWTVAE